jgi:hypothetical protein
MHWLVLGDRKFYYEERFKALFQYGADKNS